MRNQWYKVVWNLPFDELREGLLSNAYSESEGQGFFIDTAFPQGCITGRYATKKIVTEQSLSPQGFLSDYERFIYATYHFEINTSNKLSLLVYDSPRGVSELGSALADVTSQRVTFYDAKVDLKSWVSQLKSKLSDFSLRRVDAVQVGFGESASATVTLRGGGDLISILESRSDGGKITKVEFTFRSDKGLHKATINNRCGFFCSDKYGEEYLKPILLEQLCLLLA
ncbi:hypothetical protein [Leucothrix arctica]|uniref:Uncharacterized protein n=1 Tax=Leucothrix arctica TaxID=1481894 RepID=A0A317C8G4_9GAMM|nr:hypothetical protein [Leucothrix arctica]PWQ94874.1 hypothetical protein DKT75_14070 [Leucothrix arctica]